MARATLLSLYFFIFCTILVKLVISARNKIEYLPGFDGPLPFYLETGYVEVDEDKGVEMFYYFIESEKSPEKDPLILWITGGPGCSAFSGLMFEIGPLKFDVGGYTEGLPTLYYFPDSWTKVSNIIFLDSPVGTGFSYAKTEEGFYTSDRKSANQHVTFLRKWLEEHPEFSSNSLYIGGDSYSGITVPVTAMEITHVNQEGGMQLNLKGYLVGNGATDEWYDGNARVPFLHGMGLISDELFQAAKQTCNGNYISPANAQCSSFLDAINWCVIGVNPVHTLEPICGFAKRKSDVLTGDLRRRLVEDHVGELPLSDFRLPVECRDSGYRLSYVWADDHDVRATLGIHNGSIGSWMRCNYGIKFMHDVGSMLPYHHNLTTSGYRALAYSGDHDVDMPYLGTEAWVRALGFSIVDDWRAWYSGGQVAGFTRSYSNNLTFATVKGAGHTAPEYKPKECLTMLDRWLSGEPL
ncbi:Serine carboxypeptidase-like 18 [Rhynchospora pubera]|uniref:Serine carboxypeptidase-like 18 n=1 Tax=Rhynchospora pubera TaxID=906938 RepID=A0AAV8FR50_9POAL|nr:Serine carboxypeptidase-like 18 [Rhynchospora pubera]